METTHPPYRSNHHDDEEASFIEMDPRLPPSKRFVRVSSDRFGFDFPTLSATSLGFVHADEIISNSFLVPADTVKEDCFIITTGGVMNPSDVSSLDHHHRRNRHSAFRRCKRLSRRFLERCLKCLMRPFSASKKIRRESTEFERDSTRMIVCKKSSVMAAADDKWRRSCDSESSIYEAVQHCKRSY